MYTLLLTYGLNPLTGLKLMAKAPEEASWATLLRQMLLQSRRSKPQQPRMQLSLGALIPEDADQLSRLEVLTRLKFFVALEAESPSKALPAPRRGHKTDIQVYRHAQGEENYRAEVVRFNLNGRKPSRQRVR